MVAHSYLQLNKIDLKMGPSSVCFALNDRHGTCFENLKCFTLEGFKRDDKRMTSLVLLVFNFQHIEHF